MQQVNRAPHIGLDTCIVEREVSVVLMRLLKCHLELPGNLFSVFRRDARLTPAWCIIVVLTMESLRFPPVSDRPRICFFSPQAAEFIHRHVP